MDAIEKLAKNVVRVRYEDLPKEVVEGTKISVLETLGVIAAGATAPGCQIIVDLVKDWGGKLESTILIHGGKVPAHNAALVNSTMARALELDNATDRGLHLNASSVTSALAVSEMCGGISGKEFITAVALGEDLASRINLATAYRLQGKISRVGTCMPFGVAAITGRILTLDEIGIRNALGIAFTQAGGSMQSIVDGASAERVSQGLASSSGIVAAILAKRGITGAKNVLQGIHGFFSLFSNDQADINRLTAGLGEEFLGVLCMRKRYPQCGCTLAATEGTIELRQRYNLTPEDVDEVLVTMRRIMYQTASPSFQVRDNPQVDAQFSVPYVVANVLVRGSSRLEHFTQESVLNPDVVAFTKRIRCIAGDQEVEERGGLAHSALVEIRMKDGRTYKNFVKSPVGWPPGRTLTYEETAEKFKSCAAYSSMPLPQDNIDKLINIVGDLQNVHDICQLPSLLLYRAKT